MNTKLYALRMHIGCQIEDITQSTYDESLFEAEGGEWLVLTDDEADQHQDERIEDYIDSCILPELNEQYSMYFDYEAFKSDARVDGRGHVIAHYDGCEHEVNLNGEWFFIYRTN